jgi:hypothetical protein
MNEPWSLLERASEAVDARSRAIIGHDPPPDVRGVVADSRDVLGKMVAGTAIEPEDLGGYAAQMLETFESVVQSGVPPEVAFCGYVTHALMTGYHARRLEDSSGGSSDEV